MRRIRPIEPLTSTDVLGATNGTESLRQAYAYDRDGKLAQKTLIHLGNGYAEQHSYTYEVASPTNATSSG